MISELLRLEIENYSIHMKKANPLICMAARGELSARQVGRYLTNIRHLIRCTPVFLELARREAIEAEKHDLACFFHEKMHEEEGHDRWADQDIIRLRQTFAVEVEDGPTRSLAALIHATEAAICRDPTLYLAYILFAEYLTVLVAGEWLDNLQSKCGIPRECVTVIDNHVELDRDHVTEGLGAIDRLVPDPRYLAPMREVLRQFMQCFDAFCVEVVESAERPVSTTGRVEGSTLEGVLQ